MPRLVLDMLACNISHLTVLLETLFHSRALCGECALRPQGGYHANAGRRAGSLLGRLTSQSTKVRCEEEEEQVCAQV